MTVRLFASLRETVGAERLALDLPSGATAGSVWSCLPGVEDAAPAGTRFAVNGDWAESAAALADGDELALILPVSGG